MIVFYHPRTFHYYFFNHREDQLILIRNGKINLQNIKMMNIHFIEKIVGQIDEISIFVHKVGNCSISFAYGNRIVFCFKESNSNHKISHISSDIEKIEEKVFKLVLTYEIENQKKIYFCSLEIDFNDEKKVKYNGKCNSNSLLIGNQSTIKIKKLNQKLNV